MRDQARAGALSGQRDARDVQRCRLPCRARERGLGVQRAQARGTHPPPSHPRSAHRWRRVRQHADRQVVVDVGGGHAGAVERLPGGRAGGRRTCATRERSADWRRGVARRGAAAGQRAASSAAQLATPAAPPAGTWSSARVRPGPGMMWYMPAGGGRGARARRGPSRRSASQGSQAPLWPQSEAPACAVHGQRCIPWVTGRTASPGRPRQETSVYGAARGGRAHPCRRAAGGPAGSAPPSPRSGLAVAGTSGGREQARLTLRVCRLPITGLRRCRSAELQGACPPICPAARRPPTHLLRCGPAGQRCSAPACGRAAAGRWCDHAIKAGQQDPQDRRWRQWQQ